MSAADPVPSSFPYEVWVKCPGEDALTLWVGTDDESHAEAVFAESEVDGNEVEMRGRACCPFCDYAGPSEVLLEHDGVFFIEPITPVTEGHVLAIPRVHIEDALTDPVVTGDVMETAAWFAAGECNLITSVGSLATQTVKHLHVHIVPRRKNDGLLLPWSDPPLRVNT